ncbi:riboflavin synthase [Clostridium akagii]|uniref:riboflavin synthase n=1 Tax=Clostridium akagii TaxID=91623 RepID=UPI00047CAE63|nr:riboflavin synthase [Clostridium akagii]
MFTGLIEEIGTVQVIETNKKSSRITVKGKSIIEGAKVGDSISTNGVCLTIEELRPSSFTADVMAETMSRSNLSNLKTGQTVNLERSVKVGDRLGGHIVSGHIDGTGIITSYAKDDNAFWITIGTNDKILKYVVEKGSVALDGVSLTVAYVDHDCFKVSIIPHTSQETTLLKKSLGYKMNIECDVIGKYVEKLLGIQKEPEEKKQNVINSDFLTENGFI